MQSTGRGGAGNITNATKSPKLGPADLQTPTLKTAVYTTGRGGSGNMAVNKDPVEARLAQDVEPIERWPSAGMMHFGRGGAANVVRGSSPEEPEPPRAKADGNEQKPHHALTEKAKDLFKKT